MALAEISRFELVDFITKHSELLIAKSDGTSFAVRAGELSFESSGAGLEVYFLFEKGRERWRVADFEFLEAELLLEVFEEAHGELEVLRIVPRSRSADLKSEIDAARLRRANAIAESFVRLQGRSRVIRVELSQENGRYAQIVIELPSSRQLAMLADVSDSLQPEFLLAASVIWLEKLRKRKKRPIERVAIVASGRAARGLQKLCALLDTEWRNRIDVFELVAEQGADDAVCALKELAPLEMPDLWSTVARPVEPPEFGQVGPLATLLTEIAPEAIDVVQTRNGETVRYNGLPFARIRSISGIERAWFGVSSQQAVTCPEEFHALLALVEEIGSCRTHSSQEKRHQFYRLAGEAWLESLLRRNIKLLDGNLIVSPVYHQFRAENEKIDLLALRTDGRLVIIEIKVAPDREIVYQAADYWRKIEAERRCGNLAGMRLFGDREVADKPPIVYLVAPTLSFHDDFDFIASTMSDAISFVRFELNENWREAVKVCRRKELISDFSDC